MELFIIGMLIFVGFCSYILGRRSVKVVNTESNIEKTVNDLCLLKPVVQIAQENRQQRACLTEICELLHDYFFFCEFKNPQDVYAHLKDRRKGIDERTWDIEENKAVVAMYDKIIREVNPSWWTERKC